MRKQIVAIVLPSLIAIAGCSKSSTSGEAEGAAKPAEQPELPALPAPEAPPADEAPKAAEAAAKNMPKRMETTDTAADALGTLPKGVGIAPGSTVPALSLANIDGATVELASLTKDGPALVIFYRGGWCPFCNFQIQSLTKAYDQFKERGVTPVMISVDSPDEASKTSATYEIPFPVLSDGDLAAHKAFNVAFEVDADTLAKYKTYGIDLEAASGKDHHNLAVPSAFLIGTDNKVLWAHADADYKTRPSTVQLLTALDATLTK